MDEKFCPHCMKMVSITDSTCKHCQKLIDYQSKSYHLRVGTKLNKRYLIGSSLGEGGFGITYIAYDTVLALRVAIKEYYPLKKVTRNNKQTNLLKTITEADDKYFVKGKERFLEEARVLARFTFEPNIVEVRDFFEENNTAYIVMEYIDGMSLKAYIEKKGKLSADKVIAWMIPLLWALDKVHKDGIVHSDISPDNIMCNENGILKLLDFGSARQSIGERSHFAVLKMSYAPPELYDVEGHIGAWTDIYSICATLYMCITGVVPQPVVKRLLDDCIKKPSEMGISIKKSQENAIINGMELAYQKRFQSIHQLVSALSKPTDAAVVAEIDEEHTVDIETNDSFIKGEVDDLDATISCWNGLIQDENNSNVTVLEEGDCSSKASVTVLEDEDNYPLLIRLKTGEMYLCKTSLTTIGRTFEKCDLCFEDAKTMSGHHADLIVHKNKVYIKDNKSANGVFVNGDRISENGSTVLSNGAKLKLSKSEEFLFFSANNSNQVYCQKRLAAIHSIETDESMYLVSNEMQLGRSQPWSSGAMQNIKIGRKHAVLEVIGGKYYITDFSKNGTYKNEIRIQYGVRTQVFNGDVLRLGEEHFQFIILSLIDRSE